MKGKTSEIIMLFLLTCCDSEDQDGPNKLGTDWY